MKLLLGKRMFQIVKNEPDFFTKAKSKVATPLVSTAWSDEELTKIRAKLREYILIEEQNLLCAYCEKEIDDDPKNANIDHFKTRNLFPQLTLDYSNLLVSCNSRDRCSDYKDKYVQNQGEYQNIINPVEENPNEYFDYLTTGEIVANNDKAEFTIDIFKLNHKTLNEQRLLLSKALNQFTNLSLDEILNIFGYEFQSFIKTVYPKLKGVQI